MCEKLSFYANRQDIVDILDLNIQFSSSLLKAYSIKPGDTTNIIYPLETNKLIPAKWGIENMVDGKYSVTHISQEGIESKTNFRIPLRQKRTLLFIDAFYTETSQGDVLRVYSKGQKLLSIGALYHYNQEKDEYSFAIITKKHRDNSLNKAIKRLPLIIDSKSEKEKWLNPEIGIEDIKSILEQETTQDLTYYNINHELYRHNISSKKILEPKSRQMHMF